MELKFSKRKQTGRIAPYILRGTKFGNIPTRYKGRLFHSKFEAEYAMILDDMVKCKEIKSWTPQFKLKLDVNGKHIAYYIADFLVKRGRLWEIHEVKGRWTSTGKIKYRLAQALYPEYKFVLIQNK